jgi:hypothetical protein
MADDPNGGKMSFSREDFLLRCAEEAASWTDADAREWQKMLFSATGRKVLGQLQMETQGLGARALGISMGDDGEKALRELASVQGLSRGMIRTVDALLDMTQTESPNV